MAKTNLKFNGFLDWLSDLFVRDGRKKWPVIGAVYFVILAPILFLSAYSSITTYRHLTQSVWSHRLDLAYLTATTLQEKLNRLTDLSVSLASRVRFRQLVIDGKWDEAMRILTNVPRDFPLVERAFLADLKGTLMADIPVAPGVRGQNFASRDWYRGVNQNWQPYISDVYQRAAEPRLNVIAAAVPIKADDGRPVAILVLQVDLKSLVAWSDNVDAGEQGTVLVVDKRGNLVAHPGIDLQRWIHDFSTIPAVRKALRGEKGVEASEDPLSTGEQLYAYHPIAGYGWGVVVQQPTRAAYAWRDHSLTLTFITYGLILVLNCALAYLILGILIRVKHSEESHSRLAAIVESSDDAIFSHSPDGKILTWNRGAEKIYGYAEEEVVGRPFDLLVPPDQTEEIDKVQESIRRGTAVERYETLWQRKDGVRIDLSVTVSPIRDASRKVTGASVIGRDITQLKRLRNELQQNNRVLAEQYHTVQEANRLKSEFLANMSHELRTPLNAIIGFAQLMHDGKVGAVSADHKEYLGDILSSGRRLLELISDVLDLARVESGKMEFHPEPVELSPLIEQVRTILNNIALSKQLSIDTDISPQVESLVIDPAKLKQVLYNYLSNAIKFTPAAGRISIRAVPEVSDRFRLEVRDSGIGIPAERTGELFIEFKQLESGLNKRHQGTGLGLALTKKIVEAQGGIVGVQSFVGERSVFFAILPKFGAGAAKSGVTDIPAAVPTGMPTILAIDDNDSDIKWLTHTLTEAGYFIDTAKTGAEAIAKTQSRSYEAVLLDLILPDVGGWEILHAIRSAEPNRDTPVIVISVVAEKGVAKGFPIQDYLVKPIQAIKLLDALKNAGVLPRSVSPQVLVIDDDPTALKLARVSLQASGYEVVCHSNGASALDDVKRADFSAVVLDLLMPEMSGFDFLDRFRRIDECRKTPVIVWTNKDVTAAEIERLKFSAQTISLKNRNGIDTVLKELRRHAPAPMSMVAQQTATT